MSHALTPHLRDFPELTQALKHMFCERIPFNKTLGLDLDNSEPEEPRLLLNMAPELVGNFPRGMLHGGVISAVIDVAGGVMAMVCVLKRHLGANEPLEIQLGRIARISTIDLRIDYLRPGIGTSFYTRSETLRAGSRVAVVRSDFFNQADELLASGTAAYTIS